jgi:hypothetical protein
MAEQTMPEPPDGAWVVVGDDPYVLLIRDDHSALVGGNEPGRCWFHAHDGSEEPLSWAQVTGAEPDGGRLVADRRVVQRVWTQVEPDALPALAGGYETIGDHQIALGSGVCVTHGERYELPHELDRLREREGEGAGRG